MAEIKMQDKNFLSRDIDFMKEFETFLGLFLSRAQATDKNTQKSLKNPRDVKKLRMILKKWKSDQPRYKTVYLQLMKIEVTMLVCVTVCLS